MSEIANLSPRAVWQYFDEITQVPRPSKKEGKIRAYLIEFAKRHNLEYAEDATGNVVIRKPATAGRETYTEPYGYGMRKKWRCRVRF